MKRLALIIGITWLLHGCSADKRPLRTYRLINGTEKEVRIAFFEIGLLQTPTFKKRGSGLILERLARGAKGDLSLQYDGYYSADSIIVTFDMKKKITYTHNIERRIYDPDRDTLISFFTYPIDRNIFLDDAYEVINNELYEFTFTEEDYSNAEPLTAEEKKELNRLYETYRYNEPWWD